MVVFLSAYQIIVVQNLTTRVCTFLCRLKYHHSFLPLSDKWKMSNVYMCRGFLLIPAVFHFLFEIMIYVMISVIILEWKKKLIY